MDKTLWNAGAMVSINPHLQINTADRGGMKEQRGT